MARIAARNQSDFEEFADMFNELESFFGFLPNDYLTMGHRPAILRAVSELTKAVIFDPGETSMELRLLVPYLSSRAAGCMYCVAHTAELCSKFGVSEEKIIQIMNYKSNPIFSEAERAALRIAEKANLTPNAVSDQDFSELRKHYSEQAIVEIIGLVAMMSFYNKWNDMMATELEMPPLKFATEKLAQTGWDAGKHLPV